MKPSQQNRSTGPRTPEGKQRSSLNALRHGLTGQTVVITPEDLQSLTAFTRQFFHDYQPVGALEHQLVQNIATCLWRLNRIAAHEQTLLALDTVDCEDLDLIHTADDRAATACAAARAFQLHLPSLANLTLYEQRIYRQFERALKLLQQTQADRKREETSKLLDATVLKQHHDELQTQQPQPVPYNPAADQFVFSNGMLEAKIDRSNRLAAAYEAMSLRDDPPEDAAA
jgi:hypothetical protein